MNKYTETIQEPLRETPFSFGDNAASERRMIEQANNAAMRYARRQGWENFGINISDPGVQRRQNGILYMTVTWTVTKL